MPINRSHWQILLGTALLALGATVIAGWWLREPAMVQVFSGSVAVGFNTALGFILIGIALVVPARSARNPARLQAALGYALVVLTSITLLEHIFDIDLGIDQAELHRWINDGNPRPGRTSPNAAVALLIAGTVLVVTHRLRGAWGLRLVPVLILLFALIGLLGVLGYLMHLEALYRWYSFNRMALPTALGIVVASLGLWANAQTAQWYRDIRWRREDERLNFIAASLFIFVALAAGLMVFILLQNGSQKILSDSLRQTLNNRVGAFQHSVEHSGTLLTSVATSPNLIKMVHRLNIEPGDAESRATLHEIVASFRPLKFSAIAVYDVKGNRLAQLGDFSPPSALRLELQGGDAGVIWHNGPILRMRVPLRNRETQVGTIVAEQTSSTLAEFYSKKGIANSEETLVCGPQGDKIMCLPTRLNPNPLVLAHFNREGKRFPIGRALAGETGVAKVVRDYRHKNVIATFGPIGNLGLGMVVKIDANEFYQPMRERLQVVLPLLLVFVIVGTLVLNAQIKPLAAKLVDSERAAREGAQQLEEKERRIRSIVENVGEGIVAIDQDGVIESFNPAAAAMFGYRADEVIGRNIKMLMPAQMHAAHEQGMSRYIKTGEAHVIGKGSVELPGLRKDGSLLSLELAITAIHHEGRPSFIGIMRDIADRKATQERLIYLAQHDSLTDLPNRALFFDRLTQAMTRARRSKQMVGLLYLDIDHFKQINDTRGHDIGDKLLCAFAQRLIACVRAVDTVARLGGDEFTIIAEGLNRTDDGEVVAQKILRQMCSEFVLGDQRLTITTSIGIAYFSGSELSAEEFVKSADTALYRAKEAGRNRYVVEGGG